MLKELETNKLNESEKKEILGGNVPDCLGNCKNCGGQFTQETEMKFDQGNYAHSCV